MEPSPSTPRATLTAAHLAAEPFRILFPLGVVAGMAGVSHWLAYAAGWSEAYSVLFHAGVQMQVYVTGFIAGFLMTAMPRFSGRRPASPAETSAMVVLLVAVLVLLAAGRWIAAQLTFVAALATLALFFGVRLAGRRPEGRRRKVRPPVELVWVPFALVHGLAGALLSAAGHGGWLPAWSLLVGRSMLREGFVLAVVVGVGGFLAPRLMGTYRMPPEPGDEGAGVGRVKLGLGIHAAGGALLLASFVAHGFGLRQEADLFRALLVTGFLVASRGVTFRPVVRDLYVRFVWISFWMVALGLWTAALLPVYRVAALHLVFLGGYSLMTFAVATMVILSHAGEARRLRRPSRPLLLTGVGVLAALVLRLASVAVADLRFPLLGAAAAVWLAAATVWLVHVVPWLGRTIPVVELERSHEESKLRVVDARQG